MARGEVSKDSTHEFDPLALDILVATVATAAIAIAYAIRRGAKTVEA